MNHYERIKSMTVDEFAEVFSIFQRCEFCINTAKVKEILEYEK